LGLNQWRLQWLTLRGFFGAATLGMGESRHRAIVDPQPAFRQFGHQAAQGDRSIGHPGAQPVRLPPPDLARHMAADLAGGGTPRRPQALRPLDHTGRGNAQRISDLTHCLARIKPRHRTVPDIHGVVA